MSKNARISTNSEVKTKQKKKNLRPQTYVNFHELWGEATETNRVYCEISEKPFLLTNSGVTSSILGVSGSGGFMGGCIPPPA